MKSPLKVRWLLAACVLAVCALPRWVYAEEQREVASDPCVSVALPDLCRRVQTLESDVKRSTVPLSGQDAVGIKGLCEAAGATFIDEGAKTTFSDRGFHNNADDKCCKALPEATITGCRIFCDQQVKGEKDCPEEGATLGPSRCSATAHHDSDITLAGGRRVHAHAVTCTKTTVCVCDP